MDHSAGLGTVLSAPDLCLSGTVNQVKHRGLLFALPNPGVGSTRARRPDSRLVA